jgi:hypothetical protein
VQFAGFSRTAAAFCTTTPDRPVPAKAAGTDRIHPPHETIMFFALQKPVELLSGTVYIRR